MDRDHVIEYCKLHAQATSADKRLKELRAILLPQLLAGEVSPADLPFRLVPRIQKRTVRDYLTPLTELLTRMWGKSAVEKRMATIEESFESIDIEQMIVEANPQFEYQERIA